MNRSEARIHIDRFIVPKQGKEEFIERMQFNRNFIKKLPGFIEDNVYQRMDEEGNLICITVAEWESAEVLEQAKKSVKVKYKEEEFNPAEMFERLNISAERGIYAPLDQTAEPESS